MEPKQRFKMIRDHYNLSMGAFGERIGLSTSGVSAIEYGTRALGEKHIKLICAAFPDVSEHWLRTGEGDMFLPKPESSLPAELTDDPMIRAILEAYLDLDPQGRETFRKFFADAAARYKEYGRLEKKPGINIRMPLIQGTHEAEVQMRYQSKREQQELHQSETLQSDPT